MNDAVSAAAVVAFMHPDDIGKLFVPSSTRRPLPLVPEYSRDEDGVDTVKVLMATPHLIVCDAFPPKGAVDRRHMHPDHHCHNRRSFASPRFIRRGSRSASAAAHRVRYAG